MNVETWIPENFKDSLLAIARGKQFFLPETVYPKYIHLDWNIHGLFESLRTATSIDGLERWALVGFKRDSQSLVASEFIKGERDMVTGDAIGKEISRARQKGVETVVVDLHSHPTHSRNKFLATLERKASPHFAAFSPADLYNILIPDRFLPVMGLVEGEMNLLMVKTKDSKDLAAASRFITQEKFEEYWYSRFGINPNMKHFNFKNPQDYLSEFLNGYQNAGVQMQYLQDPLIINKAIAEEHKLVLYRGNASDSLVRIFP